MKGSGDHPAEHERNAALMGLAKQFNIEVAPSATDADLRAMLAVRIQQSPAVRIKIEQTFREMGVTFSPDENPSELVKKLERVTKEIGR